MRGINSNDLELGNNKNSTGSTPGENLKQDLGADLNLDLYLQKI